MRVLYGETQSKSILADYILAIFDKIIFYISTNFNVRVFVGHGNTHV